MTHLRNYQFLQLLFFKAILSPQQNPEESIEIFHITLPLDSHNLPPYQYPHQNGTFVIMENPTLIHLHLPPSIICIIQS